MSPHHLVTCRGCMLSGREDEMQSLKDDIAILNLFVKCTAAQILPNDPQQICFHCYRQVTSWASFRIMVKQREEHFRISTAAAQALQRQAESRPACVSKVDSNAESDGGDSGIKEDEVSSELDSRLDHQETHLKVEEKKEEPEDEESSDDDEIEVDLESGSDSETVKEECDDDLKKEEPDGDHSEEDISDMELEEDIKPEEIKEDLEIESFETDSENGSEECLPEKVNIDPETKEEVEPVDEVIIVDQSQSESPEEELEEPVEESSDIESEPLNLSNSQSLPDTIQVTLRVSQETIASPDGLDLEEPSEATTPDVLNTTTESIEVDVVGLNPPIPESVLQITPLAISTQDPTENWDCPVCEDYFPDYIRLRDHLKDAHLGNQEPQCPICDEKFNRVPKAYSHIISHHMKKWQQGGRDKGIVQPPRKLSIDTTMVLDVEESSTEGQEPLMEFVEEMPVQESEQADVRQSIRSICPICKEYMDDFSLFGHIRDKHFADGLLNCPLCVADIPFKDVRGVILHIMRVHAGSWTCPKCPEYHSLSNSVLNRHMKEEHYEIMFGRTCFICKSVFHGFSAFCTHLLVKHLPPNSQQCPLCLVDCGRVECIAAHLAQEHGTASVDGLVQSRRPTFNLNLNIPGDIKCHICNETFTSYSQYSTHLEEQHEQPAMEGETSYESVFRPNQAGSTSTPNPRPFTKKAPKTCTLCGKTVSHIFLHMLRRSSCRFCGKKMCTLKAMREHVTKMHGYKAEREVNSSVFLKYSYK